MSPERRDGPPPRRPYRPTRPPEPTGPEPEGGPWEIRAADEVLGELLAGRIPGGPHIVAVDGRGGAGKSTLVTRLARLATERGLLTGVVHTDDVAWHHSFFDWDRLFRRAVLEPAALARGVAYVPPAWRERRRPGSITVPEGCELLLVEGTGAVRRSLSDLYDAAVWVQSDAGTARTRLRARDGDTPEIRAFVAEWDREERPLMAAERPWEAADVIVLGTPDPAPPHGELVTAHRPIRPGARRPAAPVERPGG
ncbi:uridine kinase [Pseudonocardia alni]|uniref:uridine kinase family protein n=1 Tax=Pseudonocardia alni TaxID=33907 RepID=UPI0033E7E48A